MRNKKKIKKILSVLLAIFCVIVCFGNIVYAGSFNFDRFNDATKTNKGLDNTVKNVTSTGIQVLRVAGSGIAIIMLSYMGIKYMMAAPSEKAEFKKSAAIYIVGAILVFAASNIIAIIFAFGEKNVNSL